MKSSVEGVKKKKKRKEGKGMRKSEMEGHLDSKAVASRLVTHLHHMSACPVPQIAHEF